MAGTEQSTFSLVEAYKPSDDDEPWTLLKSIRQISPSDPTAHLYERKNTDSGRPLTHSGSIPVAKQTATDADCEICDPSELLAEFESLAASSVGFSSEYREHHSGDSEDESVDFLDLRSRLDKLLVSLEGEDQASSTMQQAADSQAERISDVEASNLVPPLTNLDREVLLYVLAARLEDQVPQWERVKGWTTYLFSNGPEGHKTQHEDEVAILQAEALLDEIIKKTTDEETGRRRLTVRNIAASAEEQDLQKVFSKFGVHE